MMGNKNSKSFRALLFAAGFGTRLSPITDQTPKCLVPIGQKPLLEFWLERLLSCNEVDRILVNTHHLSERVTQFIGDSHWSSSIEITHETTLLGTAGTLFANRMFFHGHDIFLAHADNLTRFDTSEFFKVFYQRPVECIGTMMTFRTDRPSECGVVNLDSNGILTDYFEKVLNPPGNLANAAVFLFDCRIFSENFIKSSDTDFCRDVIPRLIGRINTYQNKCYHRDIGTLEAYNLAQQDFFK